jgi:hypothetical protein
MGRPRREADAVRVMKTATRTAAGQEPARTRFARRAPQRPDEPVEIPVYAIDAEAVAAALADRLLAGRALRVPADG